MPVQTRLQAEATSHGVALTIVRFCAWSCLVSAIVVPIALLAAESPRDGATRIGVCLGWAFSATLWWAVLLLFSHTVEQMDELHREVTRALK